MIYTVIKSKKKKKKSKIFSPENYLKISRYHSKSLELL